MLDGRKIYGHRAIPRNEASDMEKAKLQKNPKDNRNLHLLRVGCTFILLFFWNDCSRINMKQKGPFLPIGFYYFLF